jgi:AraC-like DNA-binding protein
MDQNQMFSIIKVEDIRPKVRIANHHPVAARQVWERSIPDPQLLCILDGSFQYQGRDKPALGLAPGDVLFIEPAVSHRFFISPESADGELAGMHLEFTPSGTWAAGDYRLAVSPRQVTRVADGAYLQDRFKRLAAVYESYQPMREALVSAIAAEIVLVLAAYWDAEMERAARPSQRMDTILAYIRENLASPLTRQSLAVAFNLSAGYINQLFKVELGMAPSAVINRERAARAYQLIDREGLSVAEAALAVGFQDPFYFSRVFKQIYSIPPSQITTRREDSTR